MKGIIICQSVVRRQCCLGLTDSRPPFFGNILHYHLVFFSNLSLCSTKDDPKAEKASLLSFLLAFSIAQRSPSSSSASIFFYILTSQTVNTHHLSSWVLRPMVFIVCGICWSYKVRGRESEVPLSFSIYWRHKQHQQSTVNNTLQSWVLHQSHAFLACVILMNLVRTFPPSFYDSQL